MERAECTSRGGTRLAPSVDMPISNQSPSGQPNHLRSGPAPLDETRLASMADEGGVSAALMEIEDIVERAHLLSTRRRARPTATWRTAAAALGCVGIAVLVIGWLRRNA